MKVETRETQKIKTILYNNWFSKLRPTVARDISKKTFASFSSTTDSFFRENAGRGGREQRGHHVQPAIRNASWESVCACVWVKLCVCVCVVEWVWVCERERERERGNKALSFTTGPLKRQQTENLSKAEKGSPLLLLPALLGEGERCSDTSLKSTSRTKPAKIKNRPKTRKTLRLIRSSCSTGNSSNNNCSSNNNNNNCSSNNNNSSGNHNSSSYNTTNFSAEKKLRVN